MTTKPSLPTTDDVTAPPCSAITVDEVTVVAEIPKPDLWLAACANDCDPVWVCLDPDGAIVQWRDAAGNVTEGDPGNITPGECDKVDLEVKAEQWLPGCADDCDPVWVCLDADGAIVQWRDAAGNVTEGDPGNITPGECDKVDLEVKAEQWLPACLDWCDPVWVCLDADGAIVQWRDAAGNVTAGAPTAGAIRPGACQIVSSDECAVWLLDPTGTNCPQLQRTIKTLCYGPKTVTVDASGELVPVADTLLPDEACFPVDHTFARCCTNPVDPATDYPAGTIGGITVQSASCDIDCATGLYNDPTVVQWGDTVIPVHPSMPWTLPTACDECDPCPSLIPQDITITGPAFVRAWTYEEKDC